MMLIASFSELIGPPLTNARFRGQRRKLFLKAENRRIRQREEGQAWREQPRIQFALVFASVAGASVWPSISAPASRRWFSLRLAPLRENPRTRQHLRVLPARLRAAGARRDRFRTSRPEMRRDYPPAFPAPAQRGLHRGLGSWVGGAGRVEPRLGFLVGDASRQVVVAEQSG